MTSRAPTPRQLEVHAWMLEYFDVYCMWPTVREIADAFSWTSTNAVAAHLAALEKRGLVRHRPKCARMDRGAAVSPVRKPAELRVVIIRRDRTDPARRRELVRLLRMLLDKPAAPGEGR